MACAINTSGINIVRWTEPAQYYSVHHYDIYRRNDTNTAAITTADVVGRVGLGTTVFADVITAPDTTQAYWVKSIGWGNTSSAFSLTITCSVTYQGINAAYIQFALSFTGTHSEGKMHWNSAEGTVNIGMPGGSVELQLGQEHLLRVRNTTGTAITNGEAVYITGATGQFPLISRALALTVPNALVQGIATEDIAHNANGFITTWGLVRDLNTSGLNEGDLLLLSETAAGRYTASSPTLHPSVKTIIGFAISIHSSDGIILAHPRWVYPMMSLSDVEYSTADETGQFLRWNTAKWTYDLNRLSMFETANGTITSTAQLTFTASGSGVPHGCIYVTNQTVATDITAASTLTKFTEFATAGPELSVSADIANDRLNIPLNGVYQINCSFVGESIAGGAITIHCELYTDSGVTSIPGLHCHRYLSGGGADRGSMNMIGIASLTAGSTIQFWLENDTNANDVLISDCTLSCVMIGGS